MTNAKIMSIVIPSLNSPAHYLERALESVARQTVGVDAVEAIVVNDHSSAEGSEDLSHAVNVTRRRFPKLTVSVHDNEFAPGIGNARNTGTMRAVADYIGCLDADDSLRDDAVEKSIGKHEQGTYDLVFSDYEKWDEGLKGSLYRVSRAEVFRAHRQHKGTLLDPIVHGSFTEHFTTLRKASALRTRYRNIECPDYDFALRVSALSEDVNFGHVPESLYLYRHNPAGLSNRLSAHIAMANAAVERYVLEFLRERGFAEVEEVRLLHEALDSPSFFDVIVNSRPIDVPWFDSQSRQYQFARYFMAIDRYVLRMSSRERERAEEGSLARSSGGQSTPMAIHAGHSDQ